MEIRIKDIIFIALSILLFSSCNIQKRKYSNGFYIAKKSGIVQTPHNTAENIEEKMIGSITKVKPIYEEYSEATLEKIEETTNLSELDQLDSLCDIIIFKDLKEVKCIIKEVNPEIIRYTKCGFENGPLVTIRKDKVSSVIYRNGESENFSTEQDEDLNTANKKDIPQKKIEPFGVVALLIGVGAWLLPVELIVVAALVIGLSIIFGFVSLSRYTKEPEKYHGKIFSIVSLIAGLISVIALSYWII